MWLAGVSAILARLASCQAGDPDQRYCGLSCSFCLTAVCGFAVFASMPTNHTTQSRCTTLSSRLASLAFEAHDLCVQLQAQDISPWETGLYLDLPAGLLQLVTEEMYWAMDRAWGPVSEQAQRLEACRIIADAIPPERRADPVDGTPIGASVAGASIVKEGER